MIGIPSYVHKGSQLNGDKSEDKSYPGPTPSPDLRKHIILEIWVLSPVNLLSLVFKRGKELSCRPEASTSRGTGYETRRVPLGCGRLRLRPTTQ